MPKSEKPSEVTEYPVNLNLSVDKKEFTISGGRNRHGSFVRIQELIRGRKNFVFIPPEAIDEVCAKLVQARDEIVRISTESSVSLSSLFAIYPPPFMVAAMSPPPNSPSTSSMSESSDKLKKRIAASARKGSVLASSNGKSIGRIKSTSPSDKGVIIYVDIDPFVAERGSGSVNGVSIEIPLCDFLGAGQVQVCPPSDGWYEATFSDGSTLEAFFRISKMQWSINKKVIGERSDIYLDGWPFAKIVVGVKRLGDVDLSLDAPPPSPASVGDEGNSAGFVEE